MPQAWKRSAATAAIRVVSASTASMVPIGFRSYIVLLDSKPIGFQEVDMPQVMVRYRVNPDRVAENEQLVRAVYDELAASQPEGLQYATFKLPDGVTFVHIARHD